MSTSDPRRSAREELREQLLQAARRDDARRAAEAPTRRRRSRRSLVVVLALVFGAAAAAGAADLISTGDPLPDPSYPRTDYQPGNGAPTLSVKASDPADGEGWGAGIYTAKSGEDCAIAGRVRGVSLGEVGEDGKFHPFERGSTGACGDLDRLKLFYDLKHYDGVTIVFGRTSETNRFVTLVNDGETLKATPGRGGAFLWAFKGNLSTADVIPRVGPPIRR